MSVPGGGPAPVGAQRGRRPTVIDHGDAVVRAVARRHRLLPTLSAAEDHLDNVAILDDPDLATSWWPRSSSTTTCCCDILTGRRHVTSVAGLGTRTTGL